MKNKSKFTYPKCPYCKSEYTEKLGSMKYGLMKLATEVGVKISLLSAKNVEKNLM